MTDKPYDGGPAFGHAAYGPSDDFTGHPRMSLRDYIATAALQGLLADGSSWMVQAQKAGASVVTFAAEAAYEYADSMLKVRGQ